MTERYKWYKNVHQFKELKIWQKGMVLVEDIYKMTKLLPETEKYGLIAQINRSVVSIPSNIAEGSARGSKKEFQHFLRIALGSLFELETQVILTINLGLTQKIETEKILIEIDEIKKMIKSFHYKLNH